MQIREANYGEISKARELLEKHKEVSLAFQILRRNSGKLPRITPLGIEMDGIVFTKLYADGTKKLRAIMLTRVFDTPDPLDKNGCRWRDADVYYFEIPQA